MTNEQAVEMMKAKLECMTREISGTDRDCNAKKCDECDLCYAQGNMGEQKEWLRMGIEALEGKKAHWNFTLNADTDSWIVKCSCCGYEILEILDTRYGLKEIKIMYAGELKQDKYCLNCGAKMEGE